MTTTPTPVPYGVTTVERGESYVLNLNRRFADEIIVELYLWPHSDYKSVTPDEVQHCDEYAGSTTPDGIGAAPDHVEATYRTVVEQIIGVGYQRKFEHEPVGTCIGCYPPRKAEYATDKSELLFIEFLEAAPPPYPW